MRKIRYLAFLIGVTLSGVSGAVEVGSVIPGVSIQSLSNYSSEKIELSSLDGKVVYVDFCGNGCSTQGCSPRRDARYCHVLASYSIAAFRVRSSTDCRSRSSRNDAFQT